MLESNLFKVGLASALVGAGALGCTAQAASPQYPDNYQPQADQTRQLNDVEKCYEIFTAMTGISRGTTIISRQEIEEHQGIVGTTQIHRLDANTVDFTLKSTQKFTRGATCHEVFHIFQQMRKFRRPVSPPLNTSAYEETEATVSAMMAIPEFEKEFMQLKSVGRNAVGTNMTAIPDFYNFQPGYHMSDKENEDFKIGTQAFLYKLGPLNYMDYLNWVFPKDTKAGYEYLQKKLAQNPDQAITILRNLAGYSTDEEFFSAFPTFGPLISGPRVFSTYTDNGYMMIYYFTVLPNDSIQPLTGTVYLKTDDGKNMDNIPIKGITFLKLKSNMTNQRLKVFIGDEGIPGSLTDYILIPPGE